MIIHIDKKIPLEKVIKLAKKNNASYLSKEEYYILVTSSSVKELPQELIPHTKGYFVMDSDIQLASRKYNSQTKKIEIGSTYIGGDQKNTLIIAGPCSIESEEQIEQSCRMLIDLGIKVLRAGSFKPRNSPYSFQGMGSEGLKILAKMREKYGLLIATEVRDATHIEEVIEYADIVQIGAKSMCDHALLRRCGKINKPVILKRGFGNTLQEFVQYAEFILSGGNENLILCERGIRSFETKTRFTLDLCGVAYLKEHVNLPIILDPSHAMGWAYGVPDLTRACIAMGVDGLLIETHPNPFCAKSDSLQQLDHNAFIKLYQSLQPIAQSIKKTIV